VVEDGERRFANDPAADRSDRGAPAARYAHVARKVVAIGSVGVQAQDANVEAMDAKAMTL
jgi:hypothetical protein